MKTFARRRARSVTLLIIVAVLAWICYRALQVSLAPVALYTGIALFALVLVLTFFNARKKLPFIPLLRGATWLQFHIYTGFFTVLIYFFHTSFRWPAGIFEMLVALAFWIVCISGFVGIFLSRGLPGKMTKSGESLLYERIPIFREKIQSEITALLLHSEETFNSSTLPDFYQEHARSFIERKPGWLMPFKSADPQYENVSTQLKDIERYLSDDELDVAIELGDWLDTKRNLDLQFTTQRLLKRWLFVHIPITYSLILLGIAHAFIAVSYTVG